MVLCTFFVLEMAKTSLIYLLAFASWDSKEKSLFIASSFLIHFLLSHGECPVKGWILDSGYFQDHNFAFACFMKLILNFLVFLRIANRIQLYQMKVKFFTLSVFWLWDPLPW